MTKPKSGPINPLIADDDQYQTANNCRGVLELRTAGSLR
jgi:hypothetical protein